MSGSYIFCLYREPEYSPGKVEDDAEILRQTAAELAAKGYNLELASPGDAARVRQEQPALVLAMCEGLEALGHLEEVSRSIPVVNSPRSIANCYREHMISLLAGTQVRFAPAIVVDTSTEAPANCKPPLWVKRADVHAMESGDVTYAETTDGVAAALEQLRARGIKRAALQVHVKGSVVKFYGVAGQRFFRCYSRGADILGGRARLQELAEEAAAALGLCVYGGDAVVEQEGQISLIDINDWPSFSTCRNDAAQAIASYVSDRWLNSKPGRWREQGAY